jgi:class 3 adenylate cyclase/tetratricopeptide (TPR) repeat protein
LPVGARFCSSCGHEAAVQQNEERRVVTVLFADLVGFTSMAELLDPEQVKRLVDGAFERLVEDVNSFGGRVDKLLGDGILALFGAPVAHEDDAERAVRAALRMQESLAQHVEQSSFDVPLLMRVGINTGEVLVGTIAGSDYTAMGDVVNTASRIQSEAPPGRVLVGPGTHALTEGVIQYGEPWQLQPRGREQSIDVWMAEAAVVPPGSRSRRTDLNLVGRSDELALIDAAVNLSLAQRRGLLLHVIGESGVGKSRLIEEVVRALDDDGTLVLEGMCAPYGESNAWAPIAGALSSHFGDNPGATADEIRANAAAAASEMFGIDPAGPEVERMVEVVLHLLGHPSTLAGLDVVTRRDTIHRSITKVIERRSQKGPLVLWIDDLHWADQVVVDLAQHLIGALSRVPFVLVTSMRPGTDVAWPPVTEHSATVSINLQPLDREQSDELALELLTEALDGAAAADQRLLGALFDRSGGNPLFLQELATLVAEEGSASELPESLRALIAARLDELPPAERQMLDNAATLGVSSTLAHLERFSKAMDQEWDRRVVDALDAKGLLEVEGRRWQFRSDSVREATYQMLTKSSRAQRHAGVAASLAIYAPTAYDDLAHHLAAAAEVIAELGSVTGVPDTIRTDAVRALTYAAERARETGSQRLVVRHATRALELMASDPADDESMFRLRLVRGAGLIDLHDYARAREDIDLVLVEAVARRSAVLEGDARSLLGSLHHLEGNRDAAREELGRSVELLREAGETRLLAGALRQRGFIELFGGSLVDAEWFFGEADSAYRELGDERGLAYIEQHRAWLSFLAGDLDLADQRLHSAAATLSRLGDRNGVGWAFGLLAFVRFFQRRFDEAEDLAGIVRAEANDRGDDWAAAMMQTLIANLRLWQGQLNEALTQAEQARNRFRRLGDRFGMVQALAALVRTQVALGRDASMQRSAEELLTLAESSPLGPVPLLAVAGAAMHRGDGQTAIDLIDRALLEMEGIRSGSSEALVIRAIALAQLGRIDESLIAIDQLGEQGLDHPFAHVAFALVRSLAGEPHEALREAGVVTHTAGATYLDRAIAATAAAGAHALLDDDQAARSQLDTAINESLVVGDVVTLALLQQSYLQVFGTPHASGAGDPSMLGPGWRSVVERLPSLERAR